MDVAAVMGEIGDALDQIAGLRVYPFPADSVTPPAAIVILPDEVTFDETYGRGMDRMTVQVLCVAGRQHDRSAADRVAGWLSGSGTSSIKAVVHGVPGWSSCDDVRVMRAAFDVATVGGTDYYAALFDLDVVGDGES